MDDAGNITDPEVSDLLDQAAATLIRFTDSLSNMDD